VSNINASFPDLIYGTVLVVVVLIAPRGVAGLAETLTQRVTRSEKPVVHAELSSLEEQEPSSSVPPGKSGS
jgi:hypothetical protein